MSARVKIWDLPLRLTHWLQLGLLLVLLFSGYRGGEWLRLHMLCGEMLLTLLLFRLLWGFFGSETARFSGFVRTPAVVRRYLAGQLSERPVVGHNPLGGWMVLVLLLVLLLQVTSGLFATDLDSYLYDGPLAHWLTSAWSERLTLWHLFNVKLILSLSLLHACAIAAYRLFGHQHLLSAMLSGFARFDRPVSAPLLAPLSRALYCWLLALAVVLALLYLA
jgi:cytochrome b